MFFFFKQKTAYEMRISDWSSDVCSSDLDGGGRGEGRSGRASRCAWRGYRCLSCERRACAEAGRARRAVPSDHRLFASDAVRTAVELARLPDISAAAIARVMEAKARKLWRERGFYRQSRSEEHTSELQSLMRISYAVFGVKKKKRHR